VYKHILIATDGSELTGKAVAAGFDLARQLGAQVTAVTVTEPWTAVVTGEAAIGFPVDEYEKSANESATRILSAVRKLARKADITCATVHAKDQYPAEGILAAVAWQRGREGSHPQHSSGARLPIVDPPCTNIC
jgi:nucleotide-binding universal stress UspA family protein